MLSSWAVLAATQHLVLRPIPPCVHRPLLAVCKTWLSDRRAPRCLARLLQVLLLRVLCHNIYVWQYCRVKGLWRCHHSIKLV